MVGREDDPNFRSRNGGSVKVMLIIPAKEPVRLVTVYTPLYCSAQEAYSVPEPFIVILIVLIVWQLLTGERDFVPFFPRILTPFFQGYGSLIFFVSIDTTVFLLTYYTVMGMQWKMERVFWQLQRDSEVDFYYCK